MPAGTCTQGSRPPEMQGLPAGDPNFREGFTPYFLDMYGTILKRKDNVILILYKHNIILLYIILYYMISYLSQYSIIVYNIV